MNRRPLTLFIAIISLTLTTQAIAFGGDGHRIVGEIAYQLLLPEAKSEVDKLLTLPGYTTLADAANWADDVRPDKDFSRPWHYVNLPRSGSKARRYDRSRDCSDGNCVVEQILSWTAVLQRPEIAVERRREALMWITHFVGDIHQPLHAGFRDDRGGNEVKMQVDHFDTNLHALWDTGLIRLGNESWQQQANRLLKSADRKGLEISRNAVARWAEESNAIVRRPWFYPKTKALNMDYRRRANKILNERLLEAGERLAALLNESLASQSP